MSEFSRDLTAFRGARVFISGGAGVIGSALVRMLQEAGAKILVGDLKPRPQGWPQEILYRQGDLNDADPDWLRRFEPEYFFHLAATFERTEERYEHWAANDRHNLRLGHRLFDAFKCQPSLKRVVFASSYLIYDQALYLSEGEPNAPISLHEEDPIRPRNLTGVAKLLHEMELSFLANFPQTPFTAISARIFRVFGRGSRDVISRWIRALLRDQPIEVYGETAFFDYVFADDVAFGLALLAKSGATGIVNLATGHSHRVRELVELLQGYFPEAKIRFNKFAGKLEASQAELSRFRAITDWQPNADLGPALEALIAYERTQLVLPEAAKVGNLFLSSLARKVPLIETARDAVRHLGWDLRVLGGDSDSQAPGRAFVDGFWAMPRLDHLETGAMIERLQELGVGFVIPSRDGELGYYAERRESMREAGIQVMVSSPEAVKLCLDKLLFAEFLRERGLPAIPTFSAPPAEITRFVVKERFGAGSYSLGLDLAREAAIRWASDLKDPIFQPYIAGLEYSIDLYVAKNGKVKAAVVRSRDRVVGGESQVTTTKRLPELEALCRRAAELLGLYGHAVFQAIRDARGAFHLIECNCRVGGASRASAAVGLTSLRWFLLEATGHDLEQTPFERAPELRMRRFADDRFEAVEIPDASADRSEN